jgi:quercetin dioxygenase-like cupin family protein
MNNDSKLTGVEPSPVMQPAALVQYQDGATVGRELLKKPTGSVTVFAGDHSQGLSQHTAPFDNLVQLPHGAAEIRVAGQPHRLVAGDPITMPAGQPHAVQALERSKMLLTVIGS